jgi:preprotein translocase subunit SecA
MRLALLLLLVVCVVAEEDEPEWVTHEEFHEYMFLIMRESHEQLVNSGRAKLVTTDAWAEWRQTVLDATQHLIDTATEEAWDAWQQKAAEMAIQLFSYPIQLDKYSFYWTRSCTCEDELTKQIHTRKKAFDEALEQFMNTI